MVLLQESCIWRQVSLKFVGSHDLICNRSLRLFFSEILFILREIFQGNHLEEILMEVSVLRFY